MPPSVQVPRFPVDPNLHSHSLANGTNVINQALRTPGKPPRPSEVNPTLRPNSLHNQSGKALWETTDPFYDNSSTLGRSISDASPASFEEDDNEETPLLPPITALDFKWSAQGMQPMSATNPRLYESILSRVASPFTDPGRPVASRSTKSNVVTYPPTSIFPTLGGLRHAAHAPQRATNVSISQQNTSAITGNDIHQLGNDCTFLGKNKENFEPPRAVTFQDVEADSHEIKAEGEELFSQAQNKATEPSSESSKITNSGPPSAGKTTGEKRKRTGTQSARPRKASTTVTPARRTPRQRKTKATASVENSPTAVAQA